MISSIRLYDPVPFREWYIVELEVFLKYQKVCCRVIQRLGLGTRADMHDLFWTSAKPSMKSLDIETPSGSIPVSILNAGALSARIR